MAFLGPSQVLSKKLMKKTLHVVKITPRRNRHPNYENGSKEHFYLLWSRLFGRQISNTDAVVLPVTSLLRVFHTSLVHRLALHASACQLEYCWLNCVIAHWWDIWDQIFPFWLHHDILEKQRTILSLNVRMILIIDNACCYFSPCTNLKGKFWNTFVKQLTRSFSFLFHL